MADVRLRDWGNAEAKQAVEAGARASLPYAETLAWPVRAKNTVRSVLRRRVLAAGSSPNLKIPSIRYRVAYCMIMIMIIVLER